jgi:hypothetical protein
MVKLHGHVLEALDHNKLNQVEKSRLTYYNKFRSEVTFEDDNSYVYQGRKLKNFEFTDGRLLLFLMPSAVGLKVYPSVLCSKIWYIFSTAPNGQLM